MIPVIVVPFALGFAASFLWQRYKTKEPTETKKFQPVPEPSATTVLGAFIQQGQMPPPIVIQCAIAEAEVRGDHELARDIVEAFIRPVVEVRPVEAEVIETMEAPETEPYEAEEPLDIDALIEETEAAEMPSTISGRTCPIASVPEDSYRSFVGKLAREAPTFASERHVGKYRHRRDRLEDLGIVSGSLEGNADAQDLALAKDLSDAHHHAEASGMIDDHVRRTITIGDESHVVTLSGLLGVVQAAGLEGAAEWLDKPSDRKRFPHTTKMFLSTNGVF